MAGINTSCFSETIFITKTGNRYHLKECDFLKKSHISIQLAEAIKFGYLPCSFCLGGRIETPTNAIENNNPDSHIGLITGVFLLLLIGAYLVKTSGQKNIQKQKDIFTLYELTVFKDLVNSDRGIDTIRLNQLLTIDNKSLDSQRKYRSEFLKTLNRKIVQHYGIINGINRINDPLDKRIINYVVNPLFAETCKHILSEKKV